MNEHWYWQLAKERQQTLLKEAEKDQLLKEAGIRDSLPGAARAVGLALLAGIGLVALTLAVATLALGWWVL